MKKLDKVEIGEKISMPEVFLRVYNKLDEIVDWINDFEEVVPEEKK